MQPPQIIGSRFSLGDFIAQGGMGAVYRGRDLQTGDSLSQNPNSPKPIFDLLCLTSGTMFP